MKGFTLVVAVGSALLLESSWRAEAVGGTDKEFLDVTKLTKGTACDADAAYFYGVGWDYFEGDIQRCTETHATSGNLNQEQMKIDVSLCMQNDPIKSKDDGGSQQYNGPQNYSAPCADCMGTMAKCVYDLCDISCAFGGGSGSIACRSCSIENCLPAFYECGGLDTTCRSAGSGELCEDPNAPGIPLAPVIGGAGGGVAVIMIIVMYVMIKKHNRKIALEREEFAKQLTIAAANAPKITAPLPDISSGAGSASLEQPLKALYAFQADHETELTIRENETITGIRLIDDDWWLARNAKGVVGLVPQSYTEELPGGSGSARSSFAPVAPSTFDDGDDETPDF